MKFDSFLRILITGVIVLSSLTIISLIPIVTQSSIGLLSGGVATFPQAAAFVPRQVPAMVSLLVNPEKLYGIRQASLPLSRRRSDRQQWQQWLRDNTSKIGLDYQQLKPWLGDEITLAVTALDYDRNPDNGLQPGYLFTAEAKNTSLAKEYLDNLFSKQNISTQKYQGANIIAVANPLNPKSKIRAGALVGNFILLANQPQIIREAVGRAQAVDLNLEHSDNYQQAIAQIQQPHLAIAYADLSQTTAWLNKSTIVEPSNNRYLSAFSSIERDLAVQSALIGVPKTEALQTYKSLLNNAELEQIIDSLVLEGNTYIDLTENAALLKDQIPLYTITKLAIARLFPHLETISVKNQGDRDSISRAKILFKLDA